MSFWIIYHPYSVHTIYSNVLYERAREGYQAEQVTGIAFILDILAQEIPRRHGIIGVAQNAAEFSLICVGIGMLKDKLRNCALNAHC